MTRKQVDSELLKENAPLWKLIFSPSIPEWTPAKVSLAVLLSVTLVLVVISVYPKQSTRDFTAKPVTSPEIVLSSVKLRAYNGMRTTIKGPRSTSNQFTKSGGVLIQGLLTNVRDDALFIELEVGAKTTEPGRYDFVPDGYSGDRERLNLQILDTPFVAKPTGGYRFLVPAGNTVRFELMSASMKIENVEAFDMLVAWDLRDAVRGISLTATPRLEFQRSGSSLVWLAGRVRWLRPVPTLVETAPDATPTLVP